MHETHYTLDLSMRDSTTGKQLVDSRVVFSAESWFHREILTWSRDDKLVQMHLSEVKIAGMGSNVYYVNTNYVRADQPPDSSAKLVKIVRLDGDASQKLNKLLVTDMIEFKIRKQELERQLANLVDEEIEAEVEAFEKVCGMFGVERSM